MASNNNTRRISEVGLSDSEPSTQHLVYGVLHGISPPSSNFIDQHGSTAYDFGELEEALIPKVLQNDGDRKPLLGIHPPPTLEIFPSWPVRYQPTPRAHSHQSGESTTDSGSAQNTGSQLEPESPVSSSQKSQPNRRSSDPSLHQKQERSDMAPAPSDSTAHHHNQSKTLVDKAYVQQLESSKIKLTQLEQDLQRARAQGLFIAGAGGGSNVSSGAAIFDMEHARWIEENQRHMAELRAGLNAHLPDTDLRLILDGCLGHYDEIFRLKGIAAKADVFHVFSGLWLTPAERCFLWMGGFKPSELLKILVPQLEPLTEQQFIGICNLQQSSQQAEEALSQGLEALHQSLADTVVGGGSLGDPPNHHVTNYMAHMAIALARLANLESFVRQADNLRQQTLHQLRRILTVRQAVRCFLAIGEYYSRLRALSSLWASRPRESMITYGNSSQLTSSLQMIQQQPPHQNHFSTF
ncbi:transcription factor TGA2.2 isoform X2 [Amborella trichopoda]|uniref:transcription factor TGA2.2 isoform X2 n=1 Tax=Amborella trichopoda TaxID=13333 RepID=UPI0009C15F31|nr:transcription factor TGA2.2 isoform X2 [Amborella trichopoda]|eukprot:XP_020529592.1 transcription factor TGA2.2 isoform X2 [Amborella trichopoda]